MQIEPALRSLHDSMSIVFSSANMEVVISRIETSKRSLGIFLSAKEQDAQNVLCEHFDTVIRYVQTAAYALQNSNNLICCAVQRAFDEETQKALELKTIKGRTNRIQRFAEKIRQMDGIPAEVFPVIDSCIDTSLARLQGTETEATIDSSENPSIDTSWSYIPQNVSPSEKIVKDVYELLLKELVGEGNDIYNELVQWIKEGAGEKIVELVVPHSDFYGITSMDKANYLTAYCMARAFEGGRTESVVENIQSELSFLSKDDAFDFADSILRLACSCRDRIKALEFGRSFYIWDTAGDGERVRPSHRNMDGVICRWNDPPAPENLIGEEKIGAYHPGCSKGCRCIALTIVDFEDIVFPARVHHKGKIYEVSNLDQFKKLTGTK